MRDPATLLTELLLSCDLGAPLVQEEKQSRASLLPGAWLGSGTGALRRHPKGAWFQPQPSHLTW